MPIPIGSSSSLRIFDGNGKPDLVWRSRVDGAVVVYFSNPGAGIWYTQAISTSVLAVVPDLNWRIVAAGDYNNDGSVDLVWRHSVTGANVVWFMQGGSRIGTATLSDGTISDRYWGIVVPR